MKTNRIINVKTTVVIILLIAFSTPGSAYTSYGDEITGKLNGACIVCHEETTGGPINPYGVDYATYKSVTNIASMDSDGDGYSNKEELDEGYLPGDATDFPENKVQTSSPTPILPKSVSNSQKINIVGSGNIYLYLGIVIVFGFVAIFLSKRVSTSSSSILSTNKNQPKEKLKGNKVLINRKGLEFKSAFGYKGATIQYKIKIENPDTEPAGDINVTLFIPNVFLLSESSRNIPMLKPGESKTVTFDIRPTGECGDCEVSGKVVYYNYSMKKTSEIDIPIKSLSIICPMLKVKEIDETEWDNIVSNLVETEETTKEIEMPAETLFNITSRVIKDMHMFALSPYITNEQQLFNGVARFYGEGVVGIKYASQVEVIGGPKKSKLILKAWSEKEDALTGFYHGMLDEIEKRVKVKEYISDSIVQQYIHIGDRIDTQIKDSVVQRSNIGANIKKCPTCSRKIGNDEKFCLECGTKL